MTIASNHPARNYPEPIVIPAASEHTHTIILLHGQCNSAHQLVESLYRAKTSNPSGSSLLLRFPNIRWVFPIAPSVKRWTAAPRVASDPPVHEWFPMASPIDPTEKEEWQIPALQAAVFQILRLLVIEQQRLGGDATRIIIGGICQGAAVASILFLIRYVRFGGFIGLKGWLPYARLFEAFHRREERDVPRGDFYTNLLELPFSRTRALVGDEWWDDPNFTADPVFLSHGVEDPYIDSSHGESARELLEVLGYRVIWKEYYGAEEDGHWLKEPEEMDDLAWFIEKAIARRSQQVIQPESQVVYQPHYPVAYIEA
ncbi:hypothetical protein ABW21_db0204344 [Orbilia brochopaga]|nr:hypothetical protein ABW21_db0204344 [Drechslerella brochopaga]